MTTLEFIAEVCQQIDVWPVRSAGLTLLMADITAGVTWTYMAFRSTMSPQGMGLKDRKSAIMYHLKLLTSKVQDTPYFITPSKSEEHNKVIADRYSLNDYFLPEETSP